MANHHVNMLFSLNNYAIDPIHSLHKMTNLLTSMLQVCFAYNGEYTGANIQNCVIVTPLNIVFHRSIY